MSAQFVAQVKAKFVGAGLDNVPVEIAPIEVIDKIHDGTNWNIFGTALIDGALLIVKHKGDPTQGDFGTSFVVFAREGGRWRGLRVDEPMSRPYNWGGQTTRSLEQAVAVASASIVKKRLRVNKKAKS